MENEDKNRVPKLRYPGYTDPWVPRKLGDEATIFAGGDIDKTKLQESGTYPVYANALTHNGIVGYYDEDYRVKAPAVTVTGRGDVGHAQARKISFTPVVRLLAVKSNHDVDFLEHSINSHKVLIESTGVPQLTSPQLAKYNLWFPKIEEEIEIGSFFRKFDNLITLQQRKIEHLRKRKAGLLQKMFPKDGADVPEVRFPEYTDAWVLRKLGDIINVNSGRDYKHLNKGDIPVYGTGGYMLSVDKFLSDKNAVGIGRKGTINKPYVLYAPS
ncbi:restriction endonuclease subunit S [Pediococcus pentosaceus]|uniref:restriction endonuclease subunit S n=1 Tax=Pediococcus pentosaceus TaxID=1255 RepID=UPI004039CA9A